MHIAVASGTGGTDKTTVATNLAQVSSRSGRSMTHFDCVVDKETYDELMMLARCTNRTVEDTTRYMI
jgi:MinD superfamily P-loop ATPase